MPNYGRCIFLYISFLHIGKRKNAKSEQSIFNHRTMAKKRGRKCWKKAKLKKSQIRNAPMAPITPTCEFEAIWGKRTHFGEVQYLIKWRDFDEDHNSWQPLRHLQAVLPQIWQYEDQLRTQSKFRHLRWEELEEGKREEPGMGQLQNEIGSKKWEAFVQARLLQRTIRQKQKMCVSSSSEIQLSRPILERLEDVLHPKNSEHKNYRFLDELMIGQSAKIEQKQTAFEIGLGLSTQSTKQSLQQESLSVSDSIFTEEKSQKRLEQKLEKQQIDKSKDIQALEESGQSNVVQKDSRIDTQEEAIYYKPKNPQKLHHVDQSYRQEIFDISRQEILAYIDVLSKHHIVLSPDGDERLIEKIRNNLVYEHRLKSKKNPKIIKFNRIYKIRPSIIFEVKLSDQPFQSCYIVLNHMMQYFFKDLTTYLCDYFDYLFPNRT